MIDPETAMARHRQQKAERLRHLRAVWAAEASTTHFGATIHEFGGPAVEVRLPKAAALAALDDAIAGLE